jgi:hypothetical protein
MTLPRHKLGTLFTGSIVSEQIQKVAGTGISALAAMFFILLGGGNCKC